MQNYSFKIILLSLLILIVSWTSVSPQATSATYKGPYFGLKPPGTIPEIFAPDIVSLPGRTEYGISISGNLEEMYYTVAPGGLPTSVYYSRVEDNVWKKPEKAILTGGERKSEMEAFLSASEKKIYFTAYNSGDFKIWVANRTGSTWSDARMLDSPINNDMVMYPNTSSNGNIYYTNLSKMSMYFSHPEGEDFNEVFELDIKFGLHGFISPGEEYILVDAPKNGNEYDRDIYICFSKPDGTWADPISLGEKINTGVHETCPSLSPDGKYLFFSRYNGRGGSSDIYWVSTEIIESLRLF